MTISIEEAKAFIIDCEKSRENWLTMADRSWNEIKKRDKNNRLWSVTPNAMRKRSRYPAWYSIFKIRQPLLLSRVGVPIGKDTTQDGNDNVGATAAILLERLAKNLARSFDFFDVMAAGRDDFLATNFAISRAYYERDEVKQKVKEYITPEKVDNEGEIDVVFVDGEGKVIESDDIGQDDEGYFIEHDKTVDVENERVFLEPVLYRDVYIDPDIRRWKRCKRLAFAEYYSEQEFKELFGTEAWTDLASQYQKLGVDEASHKRQCIKVYEYWDSYEKECKWWAELGSDFIKPRDYREPKPDTYDGEKLNGLYNLEKLFPVPDPLMMNSPTDEFWPIPEFYQVVEILNDIHTIFSRMVALTRSIRSRLLFDNNVDGLQAALNEAAEGDAFGVPNLAQSLASAGGALDQVVQYIPVQALIESLGNMYTALDQRLGALFRLTGTSDLLQGLSVSNSDKTLGERQMEEKYAINQIAEPQRKMQEYVRSAYQLLCEMALKNFNDASLGLYMMPATLPEDHKPRYQAALGMLKSNQKRFRIELETDSTIAINEDFEKKMRIEMVNAMTAALESTANIAKVSPALVATELHCLKYLVASFRQGKMFQSEITQAIDNVIKQAEAEPAPFNKEQSDFEIAQKKLELQAQEMSLKAGERVQAAQLEVHKINAKLSADQQMLALKAQRDQLDSQIALLYLDLERQKAGVEIQNKLADNERLTAELAYGMQRESQPREPQAPQVVVVPTPAPQAGPTIINAPNPAPQTSVIQPVQEVPVPVIPGVTI